MLICKKCNIEKPEEDFPIDSRKLTGRACNCKTCTNEARKISRNKKLDEFKAKRKVYYQKNIDKMRKEKREYYQNNKSLKSEYDSFYRKANKEKIAAYKKAWDIEYTKKNIIHRIKKNLRRRIHHALNGRNKSKNTMKLIGCTPDYFRSYIESLFLENMSWDNYGEWHIDHIIPCASFDLSNPSEQEACFHFSNQRPLWKIDNLKKGKKLLF